MKFALFDFTDYKAFVKTRVHSMPKKGRGQYQKLAKATGMHSSLISQIFQGERELSPEQALHVSEFFAMNELETDYFLGLVEHDRAGTTGLKKHWRRRLEELKAKATTRTKPVKSEPLTEESKAAFYSHWYYSAIRLQTSIPGFQNVDAIADYFQLPKNAVRRVLEFLVLHGLCKVVDGKTVVGPSRTYIPAESPHAARHHTNWRLKAIEKYPELSPSELAYTSPMSLSQADALEIRHLIEELIEEIGKRVIPSPPEQIYCLNLDWFRL